MIESRDVREPSALVCVPDRSIPGVPQTIPIPIRTGGFAGCLLTRRQPVEQPCNQRARQRSPRFTYGSRHEFLEYQKSKLRQPVSVEAFVSVPFAQEPTFSPPACSIPHCDLPEVLPAGYMLNEALDGIITICREIQNGTVFCADKFAGRPQATNANAFQWSVKQKSATCLQPILFVKEHQGATEVP